MSGAGKFTAHGSVEPDAIIAVGTGYSAETLAASGRGYWIGVQRRGCELHLYSNGIHKDEKPVPLKGEKDGVATTLGAYMAKNLEEIIVV